MPKTRKMLDAVKEEWSIACDGSDDDMCAWAMKWGNPLMGALERRVLNAELISKVERLQKELDETSQAETMFSGKFQQEYNRAEKAGAANKVLRESQEKYNALVEAADAIEFESSIIGPGWVEHTRCLMESAVRLRKALSDITGKE